MYLFNLPLPLFRIVVSTLIYTNKGTGTFFCSEGNLRYHVRNKHGCDVSGRKKGNGASGMTGGRGRTATGAGGGAGRRTGRPSCYRRFKCSDCGSGFVREDSYR